MKKQFVEIETSAVRTRSPGVRAKLGDLSTLEGSIRKLGLLNPIIVDADNVVICGNRRFEACRRAGLTRIPVFKVDVSIGSTEAYDIEADENLCREPLTTDELAQLIQAKRISMHSPLVRWFLRLIAAIARFFRRWKKTG